MKKTKTAMIFVIVITLLIMQLSCATAEKDKEYVESQVVSGEVQEAKEAPAEIPAEAPAAPSALEVTPLEDLFLADTHKTSGVECSDCHEETPPAGDVPTAKCMTCHEDYRDVALSSIDPHNAHIEFANCGDCHHAHRESENQCMSCHSFSLKAP